MAQVIVGLFTPGPDIRQEGPRLGERQVTSSAFGQPIPIGFGRLRTAGNIIWATEIEEERTKRKDDQGKGGGGGTITTITYRYFGNFAIGFSEGVADSITRMWADGKLIYDTTTTTSNTFFKYPDAALRIYLGTETQNPDPLIEADKGVGQVPGFRGLVYVVFERLPLEDFGNRIPNITAEIQYKADPASPVSTISLSGNTTAAPDSVQLSRGLQHLFWVFFDGMGDYILQAVDLKNDTELARTLGDQYDGEGSFGGPGTVSPPADIGNFFPDKLFASTDNRLYVHGRDNDPMAGNFSRLIRVNPYTLELENPGRRLTETQINGSNQTPGPPNFRVKNVRKNACLSFERLTAAGLGQFVVVVGEEDSLGLDAVGQVEVWDRLTMRPISTLEVQPDTPNLVLNSPIFNAAVVDREGKIWIVGFDASVASGMGPGTNGERGRLWSLEVNVTPVLGGIAGTVADTEFKFERDLGLLDDIDDPDAVVYDESSHSLLIFGDDTLAGVSVWVKYDIATGTVVTSRVVNTGMGDVDFDRSRSQEPFQINGVQNGVASAIDRVGVNGRKVVISATDLSSTLDAFSMVDFTSTDGFMYHAETNSSLVIASPNNNQVTRSFHDRVSQGVLTLNEILQVLAERAGLTLADLNFDAGVTGQVVEGYLVTKPGPVAGMIEPLAFAYFFESVESDDKIKFVTEGSVGSVATVADADLGARFGEARPERPQKILRKRKQEVEIPEQLDVSHIDPDRDYQEGNQSQRRPRNPEPTMFSQSNAKENLAIVLTAAETIQITESRLYQKWFQRVLSTLNVGPRFIRFDPTDVVTVTAEIGGETKTFLLKVTRTRLGQGFLQELQALDEDPELFVSATAADGGDFLGEVLGQTAPTELFLFDIPLLRDIDAAAQTASGLYVGFGKTGPDWQGSVAQRSDDGVAYDTFEAAGGAVAWGFLTQDLSPIVSEPDGDLHRTIATWDRNLLITVEVVQDISQFASATELQVLNGANVLAVDDGQNVEIIQFATAVDNGDGTVTLSTILRGRRGTETRAEGGHARGARVVLLNADDIKRKVLGLSDIGVPKFYRAISVDELIQNATVIDLNLQGNDLKPYTVADVKANPEATGATRNPVTITWKRRTRLGGNNDLKDEIGTVPLAETIEEYDVELLNPAGDTVQQTKTVAVESVQFTDAEQTSAGYTSGDALNVRIFQKSEVVGRGFGRSVSV